VPQRTETKRDEAGAPEQRIGDKDAHDGVARRLTNVTHNVRGAQERPQHSANHENKRKSHRSRLPLYFRAPATALLPRAGLPHRPTVDHVNDVSQRLTLPSLLGHVRDPLVFVHDLDAIAVGAGSRRRNVNPTTRSRPSRAPRLRSSGAASSSNPRSCCSSHSAPIGPSGWLPWRSTVREFSAARTNPASSAPTRA
jgi:hypothetical protein